jgi:5-methylcytosine-specific restriction endonuclease McrA
MEYKRVLFLIVLSIMIVFFGYFFVKYPRLQRYFTFRTLIFILICIYWIKTVVKGDKKELNDLEHYISNKFRLPSLNRKTLKNRVQKRSVNGYTKRIVASNQDWKCNMCYNSLPASYEVDHIIPLFKGGTNDVSNLVALCRNCHGEKTFKDLL